jgi:hypothetical protein
MALDLYYRLGVKSQKALRRQKTRFGKTYHYRPRFPLLSRLSRETGLSMSEVAIKLLEERQELIAVDNVFS